ncbi:MAG: hypothetical protein AAF432_02030 [Planctomycetota bacterium]
MKHVSTCARATFVAGTVLIAATTAQSHAGNEPTATPFTLEQSGDFAPSVTLLRDDRVATLELDYEVGNPWTPFDLGPDGLGPVGYRVTWWPLERRTKFTSAQPWGSLATPRKSKVTALRRTQIQPLENDRPYVVQVEYVNRFGEIVGDHAIGTFPGGSSERVDQLRTEMTGFFDDFNRPEGLPDELKWNTTFSQTNDPEMQAFFVNKQFHTHTVAGTPREQLFGDRGQTTHRTRNRMTLEDGVTRRIVFDIDGVNFANRAIWYLDLVQDETEITSHVNVGGGTGVSGHPSPGLRFSLAGQKAEVYRFNDAGEQLLIESNPGLEWDGVQTFPNVRRSVEIQLTLDHVTMIMDGVTILDAPVPAGTLSIGEYTVLWTAFGYNTMKVAMPYFLIHWDNFGFDGPASSSTVHNYRTQVAGTDLVRCDAFQPETVTIDMPDDLSPTTSADATARLVFVRQMNNWDFAQWTPQDSVTIGGVSYPIPQPVSSSVPPLGLNQLINSNAAYSSYIDLGTVGAGGTAPLVQGLNDITFSASRCAFHNIHIEVRYPNGSEPTYTPPQLIHDVPVHSDFMKVGLPARIKRIGDVNVDNNPWFSNFPENFNAPVSGVIDVDVLVNGHDSHNTIWMLRSDYVSSTLASAGENPGIRWIELSIRPDGGDENSATIIASIDTQAEVAAPQFSGTFLFDTSQFPNGVYELSILAEDARGILSLPDFGGVGEQLSHSSQLNGFYYPLHITISN